MSTQSRVITQGKDQQVLVGIQKELQSMSTLILGAETYTPQSLADFVQSRIDLGNAVDTAKAAWLQAIAKYTAVNRQADVVLSDLRNVVIAAFGRDSVKLATFGFVAPKRPVLTPEQVAAAVLKAKATRKARKTMGKRQKALIKGQAPVAAVDSGGSSTAASMAGSTSIVPAERPGNQAVDPASLSTAPG